jgi:hypothetical protein
MLLYDPALALALLIKTGYTERLATLIGDEHE